MPMMCLCVAPQLLEMSANMVVLNPLVIELPAVTIAKTLVIVAPVMVGIENVVPLLTELVTQAVPRITARQNPVPCRHTVYHDG